ncbi:hypothetical protein [Streptomyces canus]|uniref:hypothetical protein n=1 Tax=Streptomyces canus TaxID=58343 RepID=UPI003827FC1E
MSWTEAAIPAGIPAVGGPECRKVTHRLWTGTALTPIGWISHVLWVGHREGDLLGGYFEVQRRWGSRSALLGRLALRGDRLVFPMAILLVAAVRLARPAARCCCCRPHERRHGRRQPGPGTRSWWPVPWPGCRAPTVRIRS